MSVITVPILSPFPEKLNPFIVEIYPSSPNRVSGPLLWYALYDLKSIPTSYLKLSESILILEIPPNQLWEFVENLLIVVSAPHLLGRPSMVLW